MNSLKGTWRLVRLALRRDRIVVPLNILVVLLLAAASAPALVDAYPDFESQASYVSTSAPSVVGRIFQGTVQDVSVGTVYVAEAFLFSSVIVGIMSILIVTRHTRYNEETGAGELIGSTVVGANAPLTAALIVASLANIVTAGLIYAVIGGIEELGSTGSLYFVAALAGVGLFFAGVAAITAQLSDYRRGANSMAIGALGAFFIVRGFGDSLGELGADGLSVSATWLSWLSPMGWGYMSYPYVENNLMPLLLLLGGFILTAGAGYYLQSKRDVGSSIFQSKPGPARADDSLKSAAGLANRLQRGGIIGWGVGYAVIGTVIGVMVNDFRETFEDNELFQQLIASSGGGGNFIENTLAAMFPLMAGMLSGYAVSVAGKISDEEQYGRIEYLMGTAVGRVRWLLVNIRVALTGGFNNLFLMGLFAATSYTLVAEVSEVAFGDIVLGTMNIVPALFLFFSIIMLAFALFGRFVRGFAWAYFAYIALIGNLTAIFEWPESTAYLSPYQHISAFPAASYDAGPAILMLMFTLSFLLLSLGLVLP